MKALTSALVVMAVLAGIAVAASAAARNSERSANPYYAATPSSRLRERQVCTEEAA
jgi:hypothetical protein